MNGYAIIENGIVTNMAVADTEFAAQQGWIKATEGVAIGYLFDGETFTAPPPPVPTREELKAERESAVAAIKVTTQAGHTFDGDEVSQGRMARAIIALQGTGAASVTWVLADNSVIEASAAELTEALALAGAAQAAIWVV